MATTASPLVLAGSALLAAGIGYYFYSSSSASSGDDKNKSISSTSRALAVTDLDDDATDEDHLTAEECAAVFDRLFREMQAILGQLLQQIQAIQMAGQNIPDAQLRAMLKGEMERALATKQPQILQEFDMDAECLEQATWEFLEQDDKYPALATSVNRFQKFWENVSNESHSGWRPHHAASSTKEAAAPVELLDPDRLVEVAQIYFDALTAQMKELVAQYKAQGKNLQEPAVQNQLNMDFAQYAQTAGDEALAAHHVTMTQFEQSIQAHSRNPHVSRQLQRLQMQQQQELMSIGSGN